MHAAAGKGQLEILQHLHKQGCPHGIRTYAARRGHLEVMEFRYSQGCPWDEGKW